MSVNMSSTARRGVLQGQFRSGASLFSFLRKKKDANGKKKSDPVKMERERVRQFSMWFQEREHARDREYLRRRKIREQKRDEKTKVTGRYRLLYFPTSLLLFTGVTILIMSLIPGIGSDTIFWKQRSIFHVVGPVILGCGIVLLMITEAMLNYRKSHLARLRRIQDIECTERMMAISQEPCKHQQRLLDTYFKSDKKPGCRFDLVARNKKPMVSVQTQTDDILLLEFIQKTHGRGSFRKPKQKLCKMESVDSAAYSMESSATCFTDLYDGDIDEDMTSASDEVHPVILDTNRQLSDMGFVPVIPNITYETEGPVCNGISSIPSTSSTTHDFQLFQSHLEPIKVFENGTSNESLSLPCEPYRDRTHSEGNINQSFQRGISIENGGSDSEAAPSPQPKQARRPVQVTMSPSLNNSVPNLNNITVTSPLLSVDLDTAARRASWTLFE